MAQLLLPNWAKKHVTDNVEKRLKGVSSHHVGRTGATFLFFKLKAHTTVFKRVVQRDERQRVISKPVIELTLQRGTIVCLNNIGNKFRASKAFIKPHSYTGLVSSHDANFKYNSATALVPINGFSMTPNDECAAGIHFFFDKVSAANYSV